ncbi:type ISP restriction/modification enzyme [Campylobacter fetus]|uniref:type ISP restriction/modification enzyme n=1 Tax=Campylobacter fetus TaxID=196 RepID=UPI0009BE2933|nr:type ISP restriction/modification enzyme [Campylobacter fetus]MPB72758.1 DEAD/DEAH box helicase [Campylobacter fetus]MPB76841.1 DEAD/DEAH box helicase [Campylobacter fetus]
MDNIFEQLLENFRNQGKLQQSQRNKGTSFEIFCVKFFRTYEMYRNFIKVDLWSNWSFGEGDCGIDIVALDENGEYIAIQCKCYADDAKLDLKDISTFLASSNRAFTLNNNKINFSKLILIDTAKDLTKKALEQIQNNEKQISRIDIEQIKNANIDWSEFKKNNEVKLNSKKKLRDHQIEAIKCIKQEFLNADRTKLIMACGTGKSLTSIRLFDDLIGNGEIGIFFAPSIALVSQTLKESFEQSNKEFIGFVVCSDSKVGSDNEDIHAYELPISPTTDPIRLANYIQNDIKHNKRIIIFSTYQSIDVIVQTQKILKQEISLIISDEAHRTAGFKENDKEDSIFTKVHSNDNLMAKKRLYMSATPKIFSDNAKSKAKDVDTVLYSMDDEAIFGRVAYNLDFGQALVKGLLSEYKVLITIINKSEVSRIANALGREKKEGEDSHIKLEIDGKETIVDVDLVAKTIATYKALQKQDVFVMGSQNEKESLNDDNENIMKCAIAFNSSIKFSQIRQKVFEPVIRLFDGSTNSVEVKHIDGMMNQSKKNEMLSWLKDEDQNIKILSNAKCLTEGVDIPALDAVIFFDARDSIVDIVQAVGRVMRRAEGKKYGYVILPIMLDQSEEENFDKMLSSDKFKVVWKVLKALRSHDNSLVSQSEQIKKVVVKASTLSTNSSGGGKGDDGGSGESKPPETSTPQVKDSLFTMEELSNLAKQFYAIIPNKLGDREYWSSFAKNVATIVPVLESRIIELLRSDSNIKKEFDKFAITLKKNINASIDEHNTIMMITQHIITRPIFDAIFPNGEFKLKNPVSKSLDKVYDKLQNYGLEDETSKLYLLYKSIGENANLAKSDKEKQEIIKNLYDNFFNAAFKKESEKLGIVYTPIEVVDFILHSTDYALNKHFNKSLKDKGVNILDPFTGTGTFIVRMLQNGLLDSEYLKAKFKNEIFANEITLLAYYIANLNISAAYHSALNDPTSDYIFLPNLLLTDTFELNEAKNDPDNLEFDEYLEENEESIKKQRNTKIDIIIGNPPYSSGQSSANDNNQNIKYQNLDNAIEKSYVAHTNSTLSKNLYDSYIRAIRWATDRVNKNGIIGYVTNGSFLDANNMSGLRHCLEAEFSYIYIFNLRGNQRTSGEESRKEGGKIFGGGSRTPVAITLLIKDENYSKDKATIYYHDIGDYFSREQKLNLISDYQSIENMEFETLKPNKFSDWINLRDESFYKFVEIANKDTKFKDGNDIFKVFSMGVLTSRDSWCLNFSKQNLLGNMKSCIDFYNEQKDKFKIHNNYKLDMDKRKISWSRKIVKLAQKNREIKFDTNKARLCLYRPYSKAWLYYDTAFNEMQCQLDNIYPTDTSVLANASFASQEFENLSIITTGIGTTKEFSAIINNKVSEYHTEPNGQIFPLYYYEKVENEKLDLESDIPIIDGYYKKEAIRDTALVNFREKYNDMSITKEDIFYYIYGLFHNKDYLDEFKNSLSKMLPRIPYCKDFWSFSEIGKELAELHLNYETIDIIKSSAKAIPISEKGEHLFNQDRQYNFSADQLIVDKMKFEPKQKASDRPNIINYNKHIKIVSIPKKAYDYKVNGKSAIEWIMDRYQVTIDKDSGIKNDPNLYSDNPKYILNLLLNVIEVSIRSVDLIDSLPTMEII